MENISTSALFTLTAPKAEDDKYFQSEYIGHPTDNSFLKFKLGYSQLHTSIEEAEDYFRAVEELTNKVKDRGEENPSQIIAWNLKTIEAWTCKIMVISKWSQDELVNWMIDKYHKDWAKMRQQVDECLAKRKQGLHPHWREEEEMFENAKILGIDLSNEKPTLEKMGDALMKTMDEVLDALLKRNEKITTQDIMDAIDKEIEKQDDKKD